MKTMMRQLRQAGVSTLALRFAELMVRLDKTQQPVVALAAALVSEAVQQGHVCVALSTAKQVLPLLDFPPVVDWQAALARSNVVGEEGDYTPLVLAADGSLYLHRYWQDESAVATAILARCAQATAINAADKTAQQRAVQAALTQLFCVISGGPGTGKTTIITDILQAQATDCRTVLAAPTGKAVTRLQQALAASDSKVEAKTVHRLLGISQHHPEGRHNADAPLRLDCLIIDEASMLDISMMALVLAALPAAAQLILVGDSRQLASVESGAVLAHVCQASQQNKVLQENVVMLTENYRFDAESAIGQLAAAVLKGDADQVMQQLYAADALWQGAGDALKIAHRLAVGYAVYIDAVESGAAAADILAAFETYRLLCALRRGPQSVTAGNEAMTKLLRQRSWQTAATFYRGQAVMVTENDYAINLFNGDTGVVLRHPDKGDLQVYFNTQGSPRWISTASLPMHETAFAMTVHKSQGAEFDQVDVWLPDQASPVLSQALLYTAITRARKQVTLVAREDMIRHTIARQQLRQSGLAARLTCK